MIRIFGRRVAFSQKSNLETVTKICRRRHHGGLHYKSWVVFYGGHSAQLERNKLVLK